MCSSDLAPVTAQEDTHVDLVFLLLEPAKEAADAEVLALPFDDESALLVGEIRPWHVQPDLSLRVRLQGCELRTVVRLAPRLDRMLRKEQDFVRFGGESARVKLRVPQNGQRNFVGVLRGVNDGNLKMEIDGELREFQISNIEKSRLVPRI